VAEYEGKDFQPMNSNWGIVPPLPDRIRDKKQKNKLLALRALEAMSASDIEQLPRPDPFPPEEPVVEEAAV
jgi:folate-dependent tRNA-U54 methylase TrmFO/GidA